MIVLFKKVTYGLLLLFLLFSCKDNKKQDVQPAEIHQDVPPKEDDLDWVEIKSLDKSFIYDLRYATSNNFVHKKMYPCAKCYVRPEVALALYKIQNELKNRGLGLKLFDCYRPGKVQKELWKMVPDPRYVADPKKGSMHNRGLAIDVTIVDSNGKELDMGTPFDYFGKEAYHSYKKFPDTILKNRNLLKRIMLKYNMEPITSEWWHYSYRKRPYPVEQWIWDCN